MWVFAILHGQLLKSKLKIQCVFTWNTHLIPIEFALE
jgi:hypothetical protein